MAPPPAGRPSLLLLSTGGTIAGRGDGSTRLNTYAAGALSGEELCNALLELQQLAAVTVASIADVDSADLQFTHWTELVRRIREALASDPDLAGILITHGTNTLEETA